MNFARKAAAIFTALTLLIGCLLVGLTMPVSATSDTFHFGVDEIYVVKSPTSSVTAYQSIPVYTPNGEPYTGKLTWTTSDKATVAFSTSTSVPSGTFYASYNGTNSSAVLTATNESGESHSCTVHVAFDGEIITAGDFEGDGYKVSKWTSNIIKSGRGEVVTEEDGNHALKLPGGMSCAMYSSLPISANTKYTLSFDVKGTSSGQVVYLTNVSSNSGIKSITPSSTWKRFTYTFSTGSSINRSSTVAFGNQKSSDPLYIDNVSLTAVGTAESISLNATEAVMEIGDELALTATPAPEGATMNRVQWSSSDNEVAIVDKNGNVMAVAPGTATITAKSGKLDAVTCMVTVYEEMLAVLPDATLQNGAIEIIGGAFGEVQPDDVVSVTVTPKEGYLMIPGTLRYTDKAGNTVRVLNKDLSGELGFGEGDGNTFKMVMPDEKVTLTADFISTEEQNFAANTIGTACRYMLNGEGEKVYDGIRFLTRLNLANKFDTEANELIVTYGGKEYTVLELGSLLKREENSTALTYENAVANQGVSGANRMWISRAYTKDSGAFKLVDYTESYIDFTSVMMTSHYDRFYTARGYIRMEDAEGNVETVEYDEITNSISTVVPILPPVQTLEGVTAEKTNWTPLAHVVEPGQKLNYTITVKAGDTAGKVTVFETIPNNATYVSGADRLVGKTAVWELELAANETKTLDYVIQVKDSMDLCEGGVVEGTATQVGDTIIEPCHELYIERAVNKFDEYYVNNAILALEDCTWTDLMYVSQVFNVAYTNSFTGFRKDNVYSGYSAADVLESVIHGNGTVSYSYIKENGDKASGSDNHLDNVAPTLYGGTEVSGAISGVKGEPATNVRESDLMVGDVIIVKNNGAVTAYIYSLKGLNLIKATGGTELADVAVLDTLTQSQAYIVLRTRTGLKSTKSSDPEQTPASESYTPEQAALISTAEAYLMRGQKVQYADTKFGYAGTTTYNGVANEYRWRLREDRPEDCTVDYTKYINCSTFCFDSYYFGLGYRLFNKNESYTCAQMVANSAASKDNLRAFYYTRAVTDEHTDEEKQQIEETFMNTIQPGDLLIILRANEASNHVMMYIGNGKMIHATGSTYRYNTNGKGAYDQAEAGIRYHQVWDYFFRETSSNYTFGTRLTTLCVVRPLNAYKGEIPQNSINRMENLKGVVAQKLSSHRAANTVSAGDSLTFTFDIRNTNNEAKTLDITETLPESVTYVSGAQVVDGNTLKWTVTVPANSTLQVPYTVRVNADTASGTTITTTSTVGGVALDCPDVTVGNTLTTEEQAAIAAAVSQIKEEGTTLTNLALVNEIYARAGLDTAFADIDLGVVTLGEKGVFTSMPNTSNVNYLLATDTEYRRMLAPTMYGGNRLYTPLWDHDRSRLPAEADLMVGDVIIHRVSESKYVTYLYDGSEKLYALATASTDTMLAEARMNSLIGRYTYGTPSHYFAVLRPSLAD